MQLWVCGDGLGEICDIVPSPVLDARDPGVIDTTFRLANLGRVLRPGWLKSVVVGSEPGILTPNAALVWGA